MVYFITDNTGLVKIGFTRFSTSYGRLADLQQGNGRELYVYCELINLTKDDEQRIHQKFSKYRTFGEWFKFEGKLKEFIEWAKSNPDAERLPPRLFSIKTNERRKRGLVKVPNLITTKARYSDYEERKWAARSGEVKTRKLSEEELNNIFNK